MTLTDEQRVQLAEALAKQMVDSLDGKTAEQILYDMFFSDFILMSDSDLLVEADQYEVEVPSVVG